MNTKYPYLGQAILIGVLAAVAVFATDRVAAAERAGPNLLIVHTDEHHFNTLGCYGGRIVKTPNVDWLASNGARCTSYYATTPVCSPSRAAFVSGRYPHHTPVVTNNIPLDDTIVTFAKILGQQGYSTGYAGKWHLDGTGKPQWAPKRNFGFADNRFMFNRGHWKKLQDTPAGPRVAARNNKGQPAYGVEGADQDSFTTDWLTQKALDFIKLNKDRRFCYMVSLPDPHGPNTVRAPYDTMYDGVDVPIPATLHKTAEQTPKWGAPDKKVTEANLRKIMPQYYGMVKCIDDNLGRLLDTLRQNGLIDKTIVVFTADHGDLCGEHGRLNKGVPYEGSAKIPFVIYYPQKIKPGTVVEQALSCVDFLPTILTLMDVETSRPGTRRDATALFVGEGASDWNDVAFIRGTSRDVNKSAGVAVVTDDYKLVYSPQDRPWLFDLKKDPDELTNLFSRTEYRDVVKRLTGELIEYCEEFDDPAGDDPKMKPQMAAAVRSDKAR